MLDSQTCWTAVQNRDRDFDGRFVFAVSTTGVYCRPSCASRLARRENVRFHLSCADAEQAGFRPCKRCRPGAPALDERRAELAGRLIEALAPRADLAKRVSQIDVSNLHDAVVLLDGDSALQHLGEERFLERLQVYADVETAVHERVPGIDYVDLRFGERMYVRPTAAGHRQP